MPDRQNIVAVGLLTAPEFELWGSKLQNVYEVSGISGFDDLLAAIDRADTEHKRVADTTISDETTAES